jgi:hypothetical protein
MTLRCAPCMDCSDCQQQLDVPKTPCAGLILWRLGSVDNWVIATSTFLPKTNKGVCTAGKCHLFLQGMHGSTHVFPYIDASIFAHICSQPQNHTYITSHHISSHFMSYIHCITLRYVRLRYVMLGYVTLRYIALHCITFHLHYIYITFTLHYITYIHIYLYTCDIIWYIHILLMPRSESGAAARVQSAPRREMFAPDTTLISSRFSTQSQGLSHSLVCLKVGDWS